VNKLIRSEWIKLRSLRTTWILAVLAVLTAMAITGAATGSVKAGTSVFERIDLLLTPAPLLVRLFIIVLGIMAFSNEYRYGTIIPSLAAAPIRGELFAAKLIVLGAFGLVLGAVVTVAATATGLAVLSIIGQPVSVFDGEIPRAIIGTVGFYGICAIVGVAAGVLVRQPTIAIGILMPWALFGEKAVGSFLPNLASYLPFTAGAQLYAVTTEGAPLDPGAGAALFLTWTALVIVVGMVLFQRRDVA
jgi:ABC-type transport system involved in multi-copper enzyme maturation permease subunit